MDAPYPPHWTLNSCFGVFHSVYVHLGSFCNCMKLVAKHIELVQLMQKFMPWSHVEIFRNRHTQPSPLGLCNILVHLGLFRNCMKFDAKRGELVQLMQKFVPRCDVGIFLMDNPNPPYWTLNSCFGVFHSVWVHLGSFRNCMKFGAK